MFHNLLRNSFALAALVSVAGLTSMSSPSLAFNPQPDPPGRIRAHNPPSEMPAFQTGNKTQVFTAKPDCRNQKGKTNPCS